jgi:hypothetical protein
MVSPLEPRPVKADPPGTRIAFIDPATGVLTPHGLRVMTNLWRRTGGFNDDLDSVLGTTLLSQLSSLTTASGEEKVRRTLETALQQVQAQGVERLRAMFDDFRKTADAQFSQLIGGLARPPQTRVIAFTSNDIWRPSPDLRTIQVYAVGGGGGGAGGTAGGNGGGGGGGANFSWGTIDPRLLPDSVTITVGAAGAGGASGANGGAGGSSSFGAFIAAAGGNGGASSGNGGAAKTLPGGLFLGGRGGNGGGGAGNDAPNDCLGCPGGGGGAFYAGTSEPGGSGGAGGSRSTASTGGGGSGGIATGADGGANATSETYIGPGFGGGGGGTTSTVSGSGGAGYNGAGGGGGAARGGGARPGGNGGAGRVWVVEIY